MMRNPNITCEFTEHDWEQFYLKEQLGEKLFSKMLYAKSRGGKYYKEFIKRYNVKLFDTIEEYHKSCLENILIHGERTKSRSKTLRNHPHHRRICIKCGLCRYEKLMKMRI